MQQSGAAYFQTNLSKPRLAFEKKLGHKSITISGAQIGDNYRIQGLCKGYVGPYLVPWFPVFPRQFSSRVNPTQAMRDGAIGFCTADLPIPFEVLWCPPLGV